MVSIYVGAHDGLTARLAARAGIDGIWISGLEISTSYGVLDESILSWRDFLNRAIMIKKAVGYSQPIIADIDTGFGGPKQAAYVASQYDDIGVDICIEDKLFPKVNSLKSVAIDNQLPHIHKQLSATGMHDKLSAIHDSINYVDVYARIESLVAGQTVHDAIMRAKLYEEVCDGIVIHDNSYGADRIKSFLDLYEGDSGITLIPTSYGKDIKNWKDFLNDYPIIHNVVFANQGMRMMIDAYETLYNEIDYHGAQHFNLHSFEPSTIMDRFDCGMDQLFSYGREVDD